MRKPKRRWDEEERTERRKRSCDESPSKSSKKKVLKSCRWEVRRRRRKASDEDRRAHVGLMVRLAKLRREKTNVVWRNNHEGRITTKRRELRRAPRRSNGEEEGAAALKGRNVQRPRKLVENGENRRHFPRWKEAPKKGGGVG